MEYPIPVYDRETGELIYLYEDGTIRDEDGTILDEDEDS